MVKNFSDSERGNPLLPHGLLFPIISKGSFICIIPQTDNTDHGLCYGFKGRTGDVTFAILPKYGQDISGFSMGIAFHEWRPQVD